MEPKLENIQDIAIQVLPDPADSPQTPLSSTRRSIILMIVTLSGLLSPMASTIYLPSMIHIEKDFDATKAELDLSVSLYLLTVGISPLFWGTLSDRAGRRWIAILSQTIMLLASIGCALSESINTLIIMRVLKAVGASACSVTGIGTISDIYSPVEKGAAMGIFFIGPMFGPSLGPLIGGIINEYGDWRSVFWFLTIACVVLITATFFFVPETLKKPSKKTTCKRFQLSSLGNPLSSLSLFQYPKVLAMLLYAGLIYGSYYNISLSQTRIMHNLYKLSSLKTGLTYLSIGAGNILGSYFGGRFSDYIYFRANRNSNFPSRPEARLHSCWPGAILIMIGLGLNGFFVEYRYALSFTLFSQFLVGLGMANVFTVTSTYLTDLFPSKAASVTACTNFMRNFVSSIVTSFSTNLMAAIGPFYLFLTFASLQIVGLIILFLMTYLTRPKIIPQI